MEMGNWSNSSDISSSWDGESWDFPPGVSSQNHCLRFDEFRSLMEPRLSAWLENDQVKILTDCFKVFDTEGLKLVGARASTFPLEGL